MINMTQAERFEYILKLEADNNERKLKYELAKAKQKSKVDLFNLQASLISTHVSLTICAGICGASS